MKSITFGSVCSGIEAASVAWHPLGWKAAFLSEIEAFPRAVLAHHYPDVPLHGDFTTIQKGDYAAIDLLVGGTPCQSFSVAGLRAGLDDPRGNLMLEFGSLARRLAPRWLVWDNVPGVLSSNGGRDFGTFLGMLGELGYGFAYRVLDAQFFGVPQRRRRVFVVGYFGDWRRAAAVLFERHSLSGHPAPSRKAGQEVAGTFTARAKSGGWGNDPNLAAGGYMRAVPSTGDISHCLNAGGMGRQDFETETLITHSLRGEGFDASEDGTGRGTPLVPVNLAIGFPATLSGTQRVGGNNLSPALCSAHETAVAVALRGREGGATAELSEIPSALRASGGGGDKAHVLNAMQVRRLTPRECERLQGFPDDYTLITVRGKPAADGPRYKALGNSMAVPVMAWIGRRIARVDAIPASGVSK